MLSSICYAALRRTGAPALSRRIAGGGVILCYHNVVAAPQTGGPGTAAGGGEAAVHLPLARFEQQLEWVGAHCEVVGLDELLDRLAAGRSLARLAALTFDDAYGGVFAHAVPVLERLRLPATVFVVADAPDRDEPFWWDRPGAVRAGPAERQRWLDELAGDGRRIEGATRLGPAEELDADRRPAPWAAIAATPAPGGVVAVGAHSSTHRNLTALDDTELQREMARSREVIAERTGVLPAWFAYPYGLWNGRVREAVRRAGYRGAVTLDYGLVHAGADPWALRRVNVPASISLAAFEAWVSGLRARGARR